MENIHDFLSSYAGKELWYRPNRGNAGDSLIAHATYQLFRKHKISYKSVNHDMDLSDKVVMYSGGGNLVPYYNNAAKFIEKYHRCAREFIILPHTINGHEGLLSQFGSNVQLLCRDKQSFDYVKAQTKNAKVYLMDDLAFSIDVSLTFEEGKKLPRNLDNCKHLFIRNLKRFIRTTLHDIQAYSFRRRGDNVIHCFRTDISEKTEIKLPPNNFDLSWAFAPDSMNEIDSLDTAYRLLKYLKKYDLIRTNRLHLCIAGILLNRNVEFYPNRYWKNEMVYETSIKDRFQNVKWCG